MFAIPWSTIYQDIKDQFREDIDELEAIREANRILDDFNSLMFLPSQERQAVIPYVFEFERYKLPADFKWKGEIDLRYNDREDNVRDRTFVTQEPIYQVNNDNWSFLDPKEWAVRRAIDSASIFFDKGIPSLRLTNGRASQTNQQIHACDALGEWTGAGGAANLTLDTKVKTQGDSSINFDLTSATAATLTALLGTAIDLSDYENDGVVRLNLWLPTATASIDIEVGESASEYYGLSTINTQADGVPFDTSRANEIEFKFKEATLTGTPDMGAVTHFKLTFNFDSATTDTDFRVDNIAAYQPENLDFEYYSFFQVKDSAGTFKEHLTETAGTSDSILFISEMRRTFEEGLLRRFAMQDEDTREKMWGSSYDKKIDQMQRRYPSRAKRIGVNWF